MFSNIEKREQEHLKCPKVCPLEEDIVCAVDGNTYVNECIMKTIGVFKIKHEGRCGKFNLSTIPSKYNIISYNIFPNHALYGEESNLNTIDNNKVIIVVRN